MEESRRGFLKTLGKLAAAVGITSAAATVSVKGEEIPVSKELLLSQIKTLKAPKSTTPKAKEHTKETLFGFSGFKKYDPAAQPMMDNLNRTYNQILDNTSMRLNPPMSVPSSVYDMMMKREATFRLDPYNWGTVFDMKWFEWHETVMSFATKQGVWEARVKPQFRGVFDGEVYTHSKEIAMSYLEMRVSDVDRVKEHAKEQCYRELVDQLQDIILERIKRDVKSRT